VAYDEDLADRIRELMSKESNVSEQKMFGGLAFLIGGNMAVATTRAEPMVMRGRSMNGWLRVESGDVRQKRQLAKWVTLGAGYAKSLPAKR
jgi:hypothetical protein